VHNNKKEPLRWVNSRDGSKYIYPSLTTILVRPTSEGGIHLTSTNE
jgi:hypothetical protein